ncbi:MAG: nucleotidyltransferase family protein [Crocosphaera sp.]
MKTLEEIKEILTPYKSFVAEKFKVSELGIFGSYVKEKQTENSDVDILVKFSEVPTLFDLVEIEYLLSEKIGLSVDLIDKESLLPAICQNVLTETVYI